MTNSDNAVVDVMEIATMKKTPQVLDIVERTFRLAIRVVKLVNSTPRTIAGDVFARQVMRSGSSIGANVEEAQGSRSKREFIHKMTVARGEARETLYWMRLAAESGLMPRTRMRAIIGETDEVVRIFTAIVKRSKGGDDGREG
ncbi:MAG: four helix bundle protein [Phycisphaerales bacterium]|nr:four helix bundle protein [Phycisphaerales bacterium]